MEGYRSLRQKVTGAVFEAAHANHVAPGIYCATLEFARKWRAAGAGLLTYSHDIGFIQSAADEGARQMAALRKDGSPAN